MTMEIVSKAATVFALIFVISSMLATGASLTVSQISRPLRNVRLISLAILANFLLMPLIAFTVAKVFWLAEPLAIGLLLLGCSGGAPISPKLSEIAKGNVPSAVGLMVLLMIITVVYLPVVLPMLLPGTAVDAWRIARSLVVLMLIPLAAGLMFNGRCAAVACRIKPALDWISNVTFIVMTTLIVITSLDEIVDVFGTRGILAGFVFVASGFGIGWVLGGSAPDTRRVMALSTAQRNFAAALVVARQNFSDPQVAVMVVVTSIVGLLLLLPMARALANR
ncbi:BASS family bile acid:Na+ symporter [Pararhizobium capsulatum DSM 1112]|uniref:BASS family bile acid:Na+ symporter n=1 Tax=Pararhizobium capsulatum DSM 1112 TaxID=1121113 RepID=A0ABU0BZE2_9HYPH|nr:bile acid:sodium symporter [Pararhizobium capsulatum]MDQ0323605.1 BASS family bile acid:Na+ symporter [Pararhizobium capsulatum DSM 1112]